MRIQFVDSLLADLLQDVKFLRMYQTHSYRFSRVAFCSNTGTIKRWSLLDFQGEKFRIDIVNLIELPSINKVENKIKE